MHTRELILSNIFPTSVRSILLILFFECVVFVQVDWKQQTTKEIFFSCL